MIQVVLVLDIETEASAIDVREAINDMLDNGVPQDTINEWEDLAMHVASAVCRSVE